MATLDTGFDRPTLAELVERIVADFDVRLPDEDARIPRSEAFVNAHVLAGAVHGVYGYAEFIARSVLVDTAPEELLDRIGDIWGITRNPATFAENDTEFSGTNGTTVPSGTEVQNADGTAAWETIGSGIIAGGIVVLTVRATQAGGGAYNAEVGAKMFLTSPIAGVQSEAVVDAEGATGVDVESDEDFRSRIIARIQSAPQGGAEADYIAWAKLVPQVDRVFVTPNEWGGGTVGIRFTIKVAAGGVSADAIPTPGDVAAVQASIDANRPVTAIPTVVAISAQAVPFTIEVSPDTPEIRQAVEDELNAYFLRAAEPGGILRNSNLREAISSAEGEDWHDMTVPAGDVVIGDDSWPTVGTITWV